MGKIILAPRAARLFNGNPSPKDYPHFPGVVAALNQMGHEVIQIGVQGEDRIPGVGQFIVGWPLRKLRPLIEDADAWMTVDSFLPHFVYAEKINKRGVVIWSQSDPEIWGHPNNINLLRGREFLRPLQYQDWQQASYNEEAFVEPQKVIDAVVSLVPKASYAGIY